MYTRVIWFGVCGICTSPYSALCKPTTRKTASATNWEMWSRFDNLVRCDVCDNANSKHYCSKSAVCKIPSNHE